VLTARFKSDAIVVDEGLSHRGVEEIRRWIGETRAEYRFTLGVFDFAEEGGETIVTCLLAGTFPGSRVRLRFFFALEGDRIASLTIME
jgi:hypothetical protein